MRGLVVDADDLVDVLVRDSCLSTSRTGPRLPYTSVRDSEIVRSQLATGAMGTVFGEASASGGRSRSSS